MADRFYKLNRGLTLNPQSEYGSGDPSGTDGDVYYNNVLGKFRKFQNGLWSDIGGGAEVVTDSTTTGSDATLTPIAAGTTVVRLTNASLVSLGGIPAGFAGQQVTVENQTGNTVTIVNEDLSVSAADRILTGSGNVAMANNATFTFTYDATISRWMLTGGSGSGSNGINYIKNPDAETGTTGWATYSNTAENVPVTGTSGVATGLTFTASNVSPLRGTQSFVMTQANSTSLQGKGVSYDFTIDSADEAQVLGISFNYNASSTFVVSDGTTPPLNDGTTTTNAGNSDIEVFVYDITNAVLIPVTPEVITANGSGNFTFVGAFQTSINSTSYRLIFHVATANANATGWTFKFDNVTLGPSVLSPFGGTSGVVAARAYFSTTGNTIVVGSNIIPDTVDYDTNAGYSTITGAYTVSVSGFYIVTSTGFTNNTGRIDMAVYKNGVQVPGATTVNENPGGRSTLLLSSHVLCVAGDQLSVRITADAPVAGTPVIDSGSLQFISSTGSGTGFDGTGRIVAASYEMTVLTGFAGSTNWVFDSKLFDTTASYNPITGVYTAPVSGFYRVSVDGILPSNTPGYLELLRNNVFFNMLVRCFDGNNVYTGGTLIQCNAGDQLTIQYNTVTGAISSAPGIYIPQVSFELLSGPAVVIANGTGVNESELRLDGDNGFGSVNTNIRRLSSITTNTGTAFTYADSATLGMSVTINEPGRYGITIRDDSSSVTTTGTSKNSSQLSTPIFAITATDILICESVEAGFSVTPAWIGRLSTNDVIRMHGNSSTFTTGPNNIVMFQITKLSN